MSGTVVFLGAGATKSCFGPLTSEILPQIYAQAVTTRAMPLGNATGITEAERQTIADWVAAGAKAQ